MKYTIKAQINGTETTIVKRSYDSPSLIDGILFLDDLGIRCNGLDENGEIVVTLTIEPVSGPR